MLIKTEKWFGRNFIQVEFSLCLDAYKLSAFTDTHLNSVLSEKEILSVGGS